MRIDACRLYSENGMWHEILAKWTKWGHVGNEKGDMRQTNGKCKGLYETNKWETNMEEMGGKVLCGVNVIYDNARYNLCLLINGYFYGKSTVIKQ